MNEKKLRETLAEIDRLRKDAAACEKMHTHWMYFNGEMVEINTVTVRRRWRSPKATHSERVMTTREINLFRSWLVARKGQLLAEAEVLAASIEGGDAQ